MIDKPTGVLGGWLRALELDRAIAYSMVLKSWQVVAGLVSIILIAGNFPPEVQGFYYTFASLIGLQSFVELGLQLVILNFASHEWSRLQLGPNKSIEGNPAALSRLVSLGRFVFKWYAAAAFVFLLAAGAGGYWFLGRTPHPEIDWQTPWLLHILFSSILLWCMPFLSLLEGCNQVALVARFRTWQAVASNFAIWAAILAGTELWAAPAFSMTSAACCLYYLLVIRRSFFKPFLKQPEFERVHWQREIFPMQWRLALQGGASYFVFSLFTPVIFYYHGAAMAGQMGMTLQIVSAIQAVATIWVATKAPRFGMLIASGKFVELDLRWRKATLISVLLMLSGASVVCLSVVYLRDVGWAPVQRVLSPLPLVMLAAAGVLGLCVHCIAIYLRAHKKEALTPVGLVSGVLMALTVWQFGMNYGATGAAFAQLLVTAGVTFPMALLIWNRSRKEWHR